MTIELKKLSYRRSSEPPQHIEVSSVDKKLEINLEE
jgi:hypothetical protein